MQADQKWLTTTSPNVAGTITVEREVMINALREQGFVVEKRDELIDAIRASILTDLLLRGAEQTFMSARETAELALSTLIKSREDA